MKLSLFLLVLTCLLVEPVFGQKASPDSTESERILTLAKTDRARAAARAMELVASLEEGGPTIQLAEALVLAVQMRAMAEGIRSRHETEELALRAVEMLDALSPDVDPLLHANACREYGIARYVQGDYENTEKYYTRCLELREEALGPEDRRVGQILYNLSSVAKARGDFEASAAYNRRAHEVYEIAYGPEHPQIAYTLNQRANLFSDQGRLEEALELYQRALSIAESAVGTDHPFYAGVTGNLGGVLRALGRYDEALRVAEHALELKEARFGNDHEELLDVLDDVGLICLERAELSRARAVYERCLSIARANYPEDHYAIASSLNNLAILEDRGGNLEAALQLYESALRIKEKYAEERAWDLALGLGNLGGTYVQLGQADVGEPLVERALALREEVYGPEHPLVAQNLAVLFDAAILRKDYQRAQALGERMLAIRLATYEPSHPRVASTYFALGVLSLHRGDLDSALAQAERAVAATREVFGDSHPDLARDLSLRAAVHQRRGELEVAFADALRAEEIGADHLRLTIGSSAERHALGYAAVRPQGIGQALSWMDPTTPSSTLIEVWDSLIRNRSMVLEEMMLRRSRARDLTDEESELYDALARASTRLANLVIRGTGDDSAEAYSGRLLRARRQKEEAERQLAARSERYRERASSASTGYHEVVSGLLPGDLLVAFARFAPPDLDGAGGREAYYVFVQGAGQEPRLHSLGSSRRLDALIASWRTEIERGPFVPDRTTEESEQRVQRVGRALARALINPWKEQLKTARRLYVVPDGGIHQVNLAALPVDGRYLLEHDLLIQTMQAERDLHEPPRDSTGEGLLVLGGAEYDATLTGSGPTVDAVVDEIDSYRGAVSSCSQFQSLHFAELPATAGEIQDVVEVFSPSLSAQVLEGAGATEAAFKASAKGRSVLHLATHAFFLGDSCSRTTTADLATARGERSVSVATETPLLLSGLAFAGANRRGESQGSEDGILTAEEVAAMDLRGVRWAVLSACETGRGVLRSSEGVLGLPRAFRVAGVQTVVLSLWRVEDQTTRDWMRSLYRGHLSLGLDATEAVQFAAREILEQRRADGRSTHPFFWAPFLALGS